MNNSFLFTLILLFQTYFISGQSSDRRMTLKEAVAWAKDHSLSKKQAVALKESGYWRWRNFKADYRPQLNLTGTIPGFTRSFSPVTQPDGTIVARSISNNRSDLDLNITQSIFPTGGQIFVNSSIQRFDAFNNDFTQFNTTPVRFGIIQPLFGFNSLLWSSRIEPLALQESDKKFVEDMERLSVRTTDLFFDRLIARINLEIASKNLANNDTIYRIAEGRFNLGTIAENELLQLELELMNSQLQLEQAKLDLQTSEEVLKAFIGFNDNAPLNLTLPDSIPIFLIDEEKALREARLNRQEYTSFKRRELEAQREIARAKADNGFSADLFASFGLTNSAEDIFDSYANPQDQQSVNLGFSIPIVDWSKGRSSINNARVMGRFEELRLAEDKLSFDQEVLSKVREFQFLKTELRITKRSDEVADKRYEIAKQRYLIGKTPITILTIAAKEKDIARRNYINSLRNFWRAYYEVRALTLYDFQEDLPLIEPGPQ